MRESHPESRMRKRPTVIRTPSAAAPTGPFSQAVRAGGFVFVAGEKGIDPKTNQMVPGGTAAETRQTLENVKADQILRITEPEK